MDAAHQDPWNTQANRFNMGTGQWLLVLSPLIRNDPIEPSASWKHHLSVLAGCDEATVRSLAEAFVSEVPRLCHSLRRAVEAQDQNSAVRLAHSLRSSFRCVDPSGTAEALAQSVETAAEQGKFTVARRRLLPLEQSAEQWCRRVATLIDPPSSGEDQVPKR